MQQMANWDVIREQRSKIAQLFTAESIGVDRRRLLPLVVRIIGNTVELDYFDGSQVTWTPTITRDADGKE
jgi:hypothetical protein